MKILPLKILCSESFQAARKLAYATLNTFLLRRDDPNVLPGIHTFLVFMHYMASHSQNLHLIQADFPWTSLADSLNHFLDDYDTSYGIIERQNFPIPVDARPFPEDFAMRGLLWADSYFPNDWFSGGTEDELDDCQVASPPTMTAQRKERILWFATRFAGLGYEIQYEPASFDPVHSKFNKPRFIHRGSFSSNESLEDLGSSKTALDLENDASGSFSELDNDPRFNSIQSTLGLPYDLLKQSAQGAINAAKTAFERPSHNKEYQESPEDWLSDRINLDMTLDRDDEVGETHGTEVNNAAAETEKNEHLPLLGVVPVDLIVFSQTGHGQEDDKRQDQTSESDAEHGTDDSPEQQDTEGETPSISIFPLETTSSKLEAGLEASFQTDKKILPSFTTLLDQGAPYDPSQAKSSPQLPSPPSSSSSSPKSQIKPHTCPNCQKGFSRASDMNKHIKYHTRPIACEMQECDFACGRQQDLTRHQHSVHSDVFGEEEFPCPFEECVRKGKKYKRRDNLGRHLKRRHGDGDGDAGGKGPGSEDG